MMKGVCVRYSSCDEEAEDILQETFIKVFNSISKYDGRGALGGWLRKVTVNTALEFFRNNKLKRGGFMIIEDLDTPMLDYGVIEALAADELVAKIQFLPNGFRTIFNLYEIEGYNHKEIAGMLDISEGTSKSQLSRAKVLLRKMITEEQKQENWNYGERLEVI